jgi:hypothetical protein
MYNKSTCVYLDIYPYLYYLICAGFICLRNGTLFKSYTGGFVYKNIKKTILFPLKICHIIGDFPYDRRKKAGNIEGNSDESFEGGNIRYIFCIYVYIYVHINV